MRARVAVEDLDDATDGVRFKVLANVSTLLHQVISALMKDIVSFAGMAVLKPVVTAFALYARKSLEARMITMSRVKLVKT